MQQRILERFLANDDGAAAVEYALVAVLVAMAVVLALGGVGISLDQVFSNIAESLPIGAS